MSRLRSAALAAFAAAMLFTATEAKAAPIVIGFEGLVDFNNYSEDGVNVTSNDLWNWPNDDMAHIDVGDALFELATNGDFSLTSVDKLAIGGVGGAQFEGFLNGVLVATEVVNAAGVHNFGAAFSLVDQVRMSLAVDFDHYTIDDLTLSVAAVPEPATFTLLGGGLLLAEIRRRRRAAKTS
jgi:hypothetical protein